MKLEADSYLKSGSNEVRILEYQVGGASFGINILKVNKIVGQTALKTSTPESHPAVKGIFEDRGKIIPIINLAKFLGLESTTEAKATKIIITEFFELSNGFLVDRVDWIHHFKWADVIDADGVMGKLDHRYVLGMVRPRDDHIIMLLDYETIIMDMCPSLGRDEDKPRRSDEYDATGRKVLIAEDSASVRAMLMAEMSELGFEVVATSDGVEALNMIKLDPDSYDLVVSDIEMPRMDGLALTCAIRNGEAKCAKNLPVIVYSSIGDVGMKARAEFLRADAHVTKLNIDELVQKVAALMKAKDQGTLGRPLESDDSTKTEASVEREEKELV